MRLLPGGTKPLCAVLLPLLTCADPVLLLPLLLPLLRVPLLPAAAAAACSMTTK
jgi:hypothetical protein